MTSAPSMRLYVLENEWLKITLSDLGASWLSCRVKMPDEEREVLVTTTPSHWQMQTAYFGATIGRYANRIANACYTLNGKTYHLRANQGAHCLHGGMQGADKCLWEVEYADLQAVRFRKIFANGEEGFGGEVKATVEYQLKRNQVQIAYHALASEVTPLCLTNHAYFNLSGESDVRDHVLQIHANHYLPVNGEGIPCGALKAVENTAFDFRHPKRIRQDWDKDADQQAVKGYDHAFALFAKFAQHQPACCLACQDLRLNLYTTMPALQLYTGNFLANQPALEGVHANYAGVALEPEFFPDTPNHPEWWQFGGITEANQPYQYQIHYEFVSIAK